jgi:endonuclease/exonuclease/phosphatase family metal-dependent hydrolase
VLSYNVFPGSPLSHLGGGIPALHKSERLRCQLHAIEALQADVLCLQELYCTASAVEYRNQLPTHHLIIHSSSALKRLIVFLVLGAITMAVSAAFLALCAAPFEVFVAIATVVAALYGAVWHCMIVHAATPAWLAGHAGGVAILVRKSILMHGGKCPTGEFSYFEDQGSDFLNMFAPRGTLTAACELSNGRKMLVCSSHMDRKNSTARMAQTNQLLDITARGMVDDDGAFSVIGADLNDHEATKAEKRRLEAAGLQDCAADGAHTWCYENPMTRVCYTRGNADAQVDHVFVSKAPAVAIDHSEVVLDHPPLSDHYGAIATIIVDPICAPD